MSNVCCTSTVISNKNRKSYHVPWKGKLFIQTTMYVLRKVGATPSPRLACLTPWACGEPWKGLGSCTLCDKKFTNLHPTRQVVNHLCLAKGYHTHINLLAAWFEYNRNKFYTTSCERCKSHYYFSHLQVWKLSSQMWSLLSNTWNIIIIVKYNHNELLITMSLWLN